MPQYRFDLQGPISPETPHFGWAEVRCNHCGRLPDALEPVLNAARMAEKVRALLGDRPMGVHSWYRCPEHNRSVGGAPDSQHLYGRALDFTVKHLSAREVARRLRRHLGDLLGGLGSYPGFVHIDHRPEGRGAYWRL
jgi:hypothetical protein